MKTDYYNALILITLMTGLLYACTPKESAEQDAVIEDTEEVTEWTDLYNGKDLTGWYTWQRRPEPTSDVPGMTKDEEGKYTEVIGLNNDPLNVFSVVEDEGESVIRISGEVFGIIVTENEYENYHLKLQFKWGEAKYAPRENEKRDSGILYHSIGEEGAWGGVWMKSFECQVQETDCGDYISVDSTLVDVPAIRNEEDERYYYNADAEMLTFNPERSYCNKGADFENESGEWNTMEIYTVDGNSIHIVNGEVNMRTYNGRQLVNGNEVPLVKGKIQLQSEGAEIFYKGVQLRQIDKLPAELM